MTRRMLLGLKQRAEALRSAPAGDTRSAQPAAAWYGASTWHRTAASRVSAIPSSALALHHVLGTRQLLRSPPARRVARETLLLAAGL